MEEREYYGFLCYCLLTPPNYCVKYRRKHQHTQWKEFSEEIKEKYIKDSKTIQFVNEELKRMEKIQLGKINFSDKTFFINCYQKNSEEKTIEEGHKYNTFDHPIAKIDILKYKKKLFFLEYQG